MGGANFGLPPIRMSVKNFGLTFVLHPQGAYTEGSSKGTTKGEVRVKHNQESRDFSGIIGQEFTDSKGVSLGVVESVEQVADGYGHTVAVFVTDIGKRISSRNIKIENEKKESRDFKPNPKREYVGITFRESDLPRKNHFARVMGSTNPKSARKVKPQLELITIDELLGRNVD